MGQSVGYNERDDATEGGSTVQTETVALLLFLLLGAAGYLAYKVNRLERLLDEMAHPRRNARRSGKVIPLLKEHIEPGPFRRRTQEPNSRRDDEER